jgi:hypothetical protein
LIASKLSFFSTPSKKALIISTFPSSASAKFSHLH